MSKQLKKELFNIYDVIVFEDENGITQDCVCVIGKERIIDEIVDVIECNNHSISIYENDSYRVWEKEGKNGPYYATNKKIIHLYTLKNDNRYYEIYPTHDYGVDNANPNEALELLLKAKQVCDVSCIEMCNNCQKKSAYNTIKQALLKIPESKHYLKWEDLEFKEEKQTMLVLLNEEKYILNYHRTINKTFCYNRCFVQLIRLDVIGANITIANSDFFNDLHLEAVDNEQINCKKE